MIFLLYTGTSTLTISSSREHRNIVQLCTSSFSFALNCHKSGLRYIINMNYLKVNLELHQLNIVWRFLGRAAIGDKKNTLSLVIGHWSLWLRWWFWWWWWWCLWWLCTSQHCRVSWNTESFAPIEQYRLLYRKAPVIVESFMKWVKTPDLNHSSTKIALKVKKGSNFDARPTETLGTATLGPAL